MYQLPDNDPGKISDKALMLSLQKQGQLGNIFRTWSSFVETLSSYTGWVTIRNRRRDSPFFVPEVHTTNLETTVFWLIAKGASEQELYFQEIPTPAWPGDLTEEQKKEWGKPVPRVLNMELYRSESYLYLIYGTGQLNLRHDIEQNGKVLEGAAAVYFLRSRLSEDSHDDLEDIWSRHPSSVIEASEFSQPVGIFHRRLVIWEARNY